MAYSSELPAVLGSREQGLMVKLQSRALSSAVGQNASSRASLPFVCVWGAWYPQTPSQDPMLHPLHRSKCDLCCMIWAPGPLHYAPPAQVSYSLAGVPKSGPAL